MTRFITYMITTLLGFVLATPAWSAPITLPTHDITVLTYTGYETRHPAPGNVAIGTGDVFTGLVRVDSIRSVDGTVDLSHQLADRELTASFQMRVLRATPPAHLEFTGDHYRLFVGEGAAKNFDPSAPDALRRATDGQPWVAVENGVFFESVNDPFQGAPRNRAWMNVSDNRTGYELGLAHFPTSVGIDPIHVWNGEIHGDHAVQGFFVDFPAPSDLPAYTFRIRGEVYLVAVPEPTSLLLLGTALVLLITAARRTQRTENRSYVRLRSAAEGRAVTPREADPSRLSP